MDGIPVACDHCASPPGADAQREELVTTVLLTDVVRSDGGIVRQGLSFGLPSLFLSFL